LGRNLPFYAIMQKFYHIQSPVSRLIFVDEGELSV
jgi:hypothetical protein